MTPSRREYFPDEQIVATLWQQLSWSHFRELLPLEALACSARAVAYATQGEFNKAIAEYTEMLRLEPAFAFAYYACGVAYEEAGELGKAKRARSLVER